MSTQTKRLISPSLLLPALSRLIMNPDLTQTQVSHTIPTHPTQTLNLSAAYAPYLLTTALRDRSTALSEPRTMNLHQEELTAWVFWKFDAASEM
ncbi:hypothetical protein GYMLUDRAFT_250343 [Collybiopsis luxurians FD-317 M1]|uniref:Uncharacterized protein n=1 Tax=Collybiopsis luxurians FD-317 M1 TaxID=944289 RepID=A0A0D0BFX1_9AGAR|nr:hypothetical protein GYMLUDRAFT_250343 [Collybiopsis luxurians FD-317 M1]